MLKTGMAAPDFTLKDGDGCQVKLSALRGKQVVLYFYPKDDTPGCTKEACAFQAASKPLTAFDAVVLGVSCDDEVSHRRFAGKYSLSFPLLSDLGARVCKAYDVYKQKSMYGRSFWGIERTTFIIDPQGKIAAIFPRVKVDGHIDEVLKTLHGDRPLQPTHRKS